MLTTKLIRVLMMVLLHFVRAICIAQYALSFSISQWTFKFVCFHFFWKRLQIYALFLFSQAFKKLFFKCYQPKSNVFCGCKYRPLNWAANLFLQLFTTIFKKGIESFPNLLTASDIQKKLFFDIFFVITHCHAWTK